jgi:hypothetical protein
VYAERHARPHTRTDLGSRCGRERSRSSGRREKRCAMYRHTRADEPCMRGVRWHLHAPTRRKRKSADTASDQHAPLLPARVVGLCRALPPRAQPTPLRCHECRHRNAASSNRMCPPPIRCWLPRPITAHGRRHRIWRRQPYPHAIIHAVCRSIRRPHALDGSNQQPPLTLVQGGGQAPVCHT